MYVKSVRNRMRHLGSEALDRTTSLVVNLEELQGGRDLERGGVRKIGVD